jgi:hypothetical protein
MDRIETNIFPVANAADLIIRYRLCRIRGLHKGTEDYYRNRDSLHGLARKIRRPVTVIERNNNTYLVVPADVVALPSEYPLVRTIVTLEPSHEIYELDLAHMDDEGAPIGLNFLRFAIEGSLYNDPDLWRPQAGHAFYERRADTLKGGIHRYRGLKVRPTMCRNRAPGICVDLSTTYLAASPLPVTMSRDDFDRRYRGCHVIYHFGDLWYEITPTHLADQRLGDYRFLDQGRSRGLLDYILSHADKPLSPELTRLTGDESVVIYSSATGDERAAPSPLCYPVLSTDDLGREHTTSLSPPDERGAYFRSLLRKHLATLTLDKQPILPDMRPLQIKRRIFSVPEFRFGKGKVLAVKSGRNPDGVPLKDLGRARLNMLGDSKAGVYESDPLDHQVFILPRSVQDSFGPRFLEDLSAKVSEYLPGQSPYQPQIIVYDDTRSRRFAAQAEAILTAIEQARPRASYGVAMIHRPRDRNNGKEDPLAAFLTRKLRDDWDIRLAVIHADSSNRLYHAVTDGQGRRVYKPHPKCQGKLSGYLRNVVLNHVLLNNQRWPFVLASPLHAELTVGVDVKNNTCGLLAVGRHGSEVRFLPHTSKQKEQLLEAQFAAYLTEIVEAEASQRNTPIESLVVHRDGRVFASEIAGLQRATTRLRNDGALAVDAPIAVVEISKTSPVPVRLFVRTADGKLRNPQVGTWYRAGDDEAYICTTGWPFLRQGTANPLHIRRAWGEIPIDQLAEDLYALSTLAWTQPGTCSRYPITTRLNDRFLRGEAGEYDEDALAFAAYTEEDAA